MQRLTFASFNHSKEGGGEEEEEVNRVQHETSFALTPATITSRNQNAHLAVGVACRSDHSHSLSLAGLISLLSA